MKKLYIFSLFLLGAINFAIAQGCLPQGITFTTQEQIDNFQANYPGCTEIEGTVKIQGSDITNLNGLNVLTSIGGNLWIRNNLVLTSLAGLESLASVGGDLLIIEHNEALTSLAGLENITSIVEDLHINNNNALTSLAGLENITFVGGFLGVYENYVLTSLTGLENITSIGGDLFLSVNRALTNLSGLEGLSIIPGNLDICGCDNLTSMTGLENITSIGGNLSILGNPVLTSLSGLDNLASIGGALWISSDNSLTSLTGLENLTSISSNLIIGPGLIGGGNLSLTSLSGLDNLTTIGGLLRISENDALSSLYALENVNFVTALRVYENDALTSLSGLDNIAASSIYNLYIGYNPSLSACAVQSICDYLAAPNGTVEIHDNAPGCNSPEEVEEACLSVGVPLPGSLQTEVNIYPNPTGGMLNFGFRLPAGRSQAGISECQRLSLKIYDAMGREVAVLMDGILPAGEHSIEWNMEALPAGIYYFRLQTDNRLSTGKLMKL